MEFDFNYNQKFGDGEYLVIYRYPSLEGDEVRRGAAIMPVSRRSRSRRYEMKIREDKFDVVVIAGKLYVHRRGFFEKFEETYKMCVPTVTIGQWRFMKYDWRELKRC